MAVNLFHTRRVNYFKCAYWNDIKRTLNELLYDNKPDGIFYGKIITPKYEQMSEFNNRIRYSKETITLKTADNVNNLSIDSIVRYNKQLWIVSGIEREIIVKESYYGKQQYETIITLRKE